MLEARIAALEAEIREAEQRLPELLKTAREEGAREALKSRSDAEAKRLERLGEGISEAMALWSKRLATLEGLSATLAHSILERVFADGAERSAAVSSALEARLAQLETQSIVRARVSGADFSDSGSLEALNADLGGRISIVSDAKLKAGECVIDLKLGHLDVGPAAQWRRIAEFLDQLECEGL